jgi:hypothetical protein
MKPKQQKELRTTLLQLIGESGYTSTELLLVDELIDWVVINNRIKERLALQCVPADRRQGQNGNRAGSLYAQLPDRRQELSLLPPPTLI